MKNCKIDVILGCFGRRDDDFISCASVENIIFSLGKNDFQFKEIMDYFAAVRLFDRPLLDGNAIKHFIFNMQNTFYSNGGKQKLWSEKNFGLYQKFILDHRYCGLFVKLQLVE